MTLTMNQPTTTHSPEMGRFSSFEFIEDRKFDFATGRAIELISKASGRTKTKRLQMLEEAAWFIRQRIEKPESLKCQKGIILAWEYCETKRLSPVLSTAVCNICNTASVIGNNHYVKSMLISALEEILKEIEGTTKYL